MKAEDIVDQESFGAWARRSQLTDNDLRTVAVRAALRALPVGWFLGENREGAILSRLFFLRCLLLADTELKDSPKDASALVYKAKVKGNAAYAFNAAAHACALTTGDFRSVMVSEAISYTALAARNHESSIWMETGDDIVHLEHSRAIIPLWSGPSPFDDLWKGILRHYSRQPELEDAGWKFWLDWYSQVLAGQARDADLNTRICTEVRWNGSSATILSDILKIWGRVKTFKLPEGIEQKQKSKSRAAQIAAAVRTNREALPATFDALEGFVMLEIQRIQRDNWLNVHNPDEAERIIQSLCTIYDCVQALRSVTLSNTSFAEDDAEKTIPLLDVYREKFIALPRAKADEIVEGTYGVAKGGVQVGLIMGTSALFSYFGLPALGGAIAGSIGFGLKGAADIVKAARKDKDQNVE